MGGACQAISMHRPMRDRADLAWLLAGWVAIANTSDETWA